MQISIKKKLNISFELAVKKVTEELAKQGFGIITTIDVQDVLKKKLNKEFRKFLILGACNPEFAHNAIEQNDEVSLLLPCNVVIQEKESLVEIMAFNPDVLTKLFDDEKLRDLSVILKERIEEVFKNL
ncbi:MAG: hypothetical protein IGBAC_1917 [Ignavibacteriae bacterium]|nr:MAG: hypothetical protein IGBAC_1917 [Ignavibacteriota bacterium]